MIKIKIVELHDDHSLRAVVVSGYDTINNGRVYSLEEIDEGTAKQNKLAHSLIGAYFNSGAFSDNVTTSQDLKEMLKYRIGERFDKYVYIDPENLEAGIQDAKKYKDIPHRS